MALPKGHINTVAVAECQILAAGEEKEVEQTSGHAGFRFTSLVLCANKRRSLQLENKP